MGRPTFVRRLGFPALVVAALGLSACGPAMEATVVGSSEALGDNRHVVETRVIHMADVNGDLGDINGYVWDNNLNGNPRELVSVSDTNQKCVKQGNGIACHGFTEGQSDDVTITYLIPKDVDKSSHFELNDASSGNAAVLLNL